ncbi:flavin monoamine oxidase family protein, partial [Acidisphaera rubrifaciens]|uniref:flavin monoamine oxidase family protein n=1 Tax=Acidisphaera rubrifaciens TaxID=50715 RepID=UPI000662BC2A
GVARAGGVGAAYRAMAAMGLLAVPEAYAGPPALPAGSGQRVVILGAGIAGMVAALELLRAGHDPLVIEARDRAGGRNWTLRGGDTVTETTSRQTVAWDRAPHLWFNPGPARLPWHHAGILDYCRQLGVALEVMSNDNRAAWMQDDRAFGGRRQRNRAIVAQLRGTVAELAAKALDQGALAAEVTEEDLVRLRQMLRGFGALDHDMTYRGSGRGGWTVAPGAGPGDGVPAPPLDLRQLLRADFWAYKANFGELPDQAPTMLQPAGGMGRIGEAFGRALAGRIVFGTEVTAIRREGTGTRLMLRDAAGTRAMTAAHVICTLPFPVLRGIPADFSPATRAAIGRLAYVPAGKAAFQATRRFWEEDEGIYGGISWTRRDITQVWYPSAGIHQPDGILVGAYVWDDDAGGRFAARRPAARLDAALADLDALHPGAAPMLTRGVTVAWPNVPYSLGAWAEWDAAGRADAYPALLDGDGPVLFAGEHMSWINGWQEGAVRSAHAALARLAPRLAAAALP